MVLYLANLGYKAERILNQAHTEGLPDVKAVKGDKTYTFEVKTYKEAFKSVYDLHFKYRPSKSAYVQCLLLGDDYYCAITTDFDLLTVKSEWFFAPPSPDDVRAYKRIKALDVQRNQADYLVIKDNNKPRLFLQYWRPLEA